ncbi:hypothetical protein [Actinomadura pelletieri]|uniref:hypothetical protein n=1 Tax=Actinomadura pelletieri TaxID=111805 RepID=UPI0011C34F7E|nr:hypothetical protein [Actinomadura pelletieri]
MILTLSVPSEVILTLSVPTASSADALAATEAAPTMTIPVAITVTRRRFIVPPHVEPEKFLGARIVASVPPPR